jgi:hypothetical protein
VPPRAPAPPVELLIGLEVPPVKEVPPVPPVKLVPPVDELLPKPLLLLLPKPLLVPPLVPKPLDPDEVPEVCAKALETPAVNKPTTATPIFRYPLKKSLLTCIAAPCMIAFWDYRESWFYIDLHIPGHIADHTENSE